MMKKLLILMLVLGMASVANADLTWSTSDVTVDVGATVDVTLVSSDATQAAAWVGQEPGGIAEITAIAIINPGAGGNASVDDPTASGYPGWWVVTSSDTEEPYTVAAGNQYTVTITGLVLGTTLMDSDSYGAFGTAGVGNLTVTVIPEPMTIALLGLGGLFLLRRRK